MKIQDRKAFLQKIVEKLEGEKKPIDYSGTAQDPKELQTNIDRFVETMAFNDALDSAIEIIKKEMEESV